MNIIKTYFKLVEKNNIPLVIMLIIFFFFSINYLVNQKIDQDASQYSQKYTIALFNKTADEHVEFRKYLKDNFNIKEIADNEEAIKDALFLKEIDYALIIDNDGVHGYNMVIASEGYMVKSQIAEYLSMQAIYEKYGKEDKNFVAKTLEQKNIVELVSETDSKGLIARKLQRSYLDFSTYMLMSNVMGVVCLTSLSLRKKGIRERLKISNTSSKSIELQLLLGNLVILLSMIALIFILPKFFLNDYILFSSHNLLLMFNTLMFGLSLIGFALLISQLVTNIMIISGVTSIISLGFSFISGTFVSQALLPDIALNISKFFPAYWFIKGNEILSSSAAASKEVLLSYASILGIIALMGIVFFVVASLISNKRKMIV